MASLSCINRADRTEFVAMLGGVFEHSPWVVDEAYAARPFAGLDALHGAMMAVVEAAPRARRLALLNAHPDLGARAEVVPDLTPDSLNEQMSAGLTRLDPEEFAWFARCNRDYRERFGFPFIIAVRQHTKAEIIARFEAALVAEPEAELARAIGEIGRITRLRLAGLVGGA